jgi:tetratricopeptide (TPR) repeat protein
MLDALLGESADLLPLKELLIRRTGGNPFFLEECLRTLVEIGAVAGERGSHTLLKDVSEIQIPSTIQALLTARIDRLSPEEKQLLQSASTIGTRLTYPLLFAVAGISKENLNQGLASLEAAEFLFETASGPERAIQFKHAITQEVAYGTLVQERRRTLHAVTVDTIERQAGGRLDEHVDRLAHHAFQGEVWDKAIQYSQQAGFKAMSRSAYPGAVSNFERALEALKHLPETRETIEQSIDLRFPLRDSLHALGELERTIEHLREAEKLANKLDDPYRLGRINGYMALYFCRTGASDLAIESAQRALTLNYRFGDLSTEIVARYFLANAFIGKGEYARAKEEFHRGIALLEGDLVYERFALSGLPSVLTRVWLVWCQAERGEFQEGTFWSKKALEIAEEADDSFSLAAAHFGSGFVLLRKGDAAESIPILERSLEICQTTKIRIWVPWVTSILGLAQVLSGHPAEGFPLLEYAIDQSRDMNLICHVSLHVANLSRSHLLAGRADEALSQAEHALDLSRELDEKGHEAWCLRLLGDIHARPGDLDAEKAETCYQQSLAIAKDRGMPPLIAHSRKGLGTLYAQTGREEKAREELSAACDMYREMGMDSYLKQAESPS